MPTTKELATALLCAAAGCISGCATIAVTSQVNTPLIRSVQCRTFAWAGSLGRGPLSATLANPVNEARLRSDIQTHLAAVGVQPATSAADCLVGYGIGVHNELEDWGWGWGWGPWWGGPYMYPQAIVGVDLYDARTGQPLWHAYAREDVVDLKADRAAQGIESAVSAIFTKYPG